MRISGDWLRRPIAVCLVSFLAVPFGEAATARVLPAPPTQQVQSPAAAPAPAVTTANKPAANPPNSESLPNNPGAAPQTAAPAQPSPGSTPQEQQNSTSAPVGTAAAPYVNPLGVPASRPAGAAIAPAKQKRARSFLIKVGIIVGAAIAVGTVVGLSKTSPSRPN